MYFRNGGRNSSCSVDCVTYLQHQNKIDVDSSFTNYMEVKVNKLYIETDYMGVGTDTSKYL